MNASHPAASVRLSLPMQQQPTESSCGPTCLHAVYGFWRHDEPLKAVMSRTRKLDTGGTYAVFLGCDALRQGFDALIFTYNLRVFDPTWFHPDVDLADRLRAQAGFKHAGWLQHATEGYLDFLALGGRIRFTDLSPRLIRGLLRHGLPVLTGLSSTCLYRTAREWGSDDQPDDVRGRPAGHFVVLAGYDLDGDRVLIADPYGANPYSPAREYWIGMDRLINAVLLGVVTHDANLLILCPRRADGGLPCTN